MVIVLPLHALRIPASFTQAEREVLLLVLEGLSNAEIAARRRRSERTIANQIASLLTKADVYTRAELLAACAPGEPVVPGGWTQLLEGAWRLQRPKREGRALRFVAVECRRRLSAEDRVALEAAAAGAPNKQIAPVLGVGVRAAGRRVSVALGKLGVDRLYLPLLRALSTSFARCVA